MAIVPLDSTLLLKNLKAKLIGILSSDPDFILQHADSNLLLSDSDYKKVNATTNPCEKVRDLLDHIIQRGPEAAQNLLGLLKGKDMQQNFPRLAFLMDLSLLELQCAELNEAMTRKRKVTESEDNRPAKLLCNKASNLVTEKQLMLVARGIGRSWKEIGRLALGIPSVKLEQFEEDYPNSHVERVFAMLRCWSARQRKLATTAHLHSLLSQEDWALPSDNIDFLLETS